MPGLYKGVVIAAAWPGVASGHGERIEKHGKGDTPHRITVVGMNDLGADAEISHDSLEEVLGVFFRFRRLDSPADDRSAIKVDDGVGVQENACHVRLEPGDVPRPDLVRPRDVNVVGFRRPSRLPGLATVSQGLAASQDAIERRRTRDVGALSCQCRDDLLRRLVGETAAVGNLKELLFFFRRKAMGYRPRAAFSPVFRAVAAPVLNRTPVQAQNTAG